MSVKTFWMVIWIRLSTAVYDGEPQNRRGSHRTGVESGNVDSILDGNLDPFINGYLKWIALGGKQPENATEEME